MTGVVTNFVPNTMARADQINSAFALCFPAASVSPFSETALAKTSAPEWRLTMGAVAAPAAANDNEVALFDAGAGAVKSSGVVWGNVARVNINQTWTGAQTFNGAITVPNQTVGNGDGSAANTKYVYDFFNAAFNVTVAPLNSPAFTGNPTAPTPAAGDNDTSIATTAFVQTAINNRVPATNTQYGLIYGNGSSALGVTAAMTNGQVLVGQTGAAPLPKTVSGDATMAATGALTVTKINGAPVGTAAGNIVALDGSARLPPVDGSQLINLPTSGGGSIVNLTISVTSNSALSVTADRLPMYTSSGGARVFNAVSVSVDLASGGLDTGSEAAATWYYVWLFSDGTNLTGRLSASATAPTAPGGYTYSARVGAVRNDASSNLWRTLQKGRVARIVNGTNPATPPQIASISTAGWTSASVSAFVPPTASSIIVTMVAGVGATGAIAPNNSYATGGNIPTNTAPIQGYNPGTGSVNAVTSTLVLESSNIYLDRSAGTIQAYAYGWEDTI